MNKCYYFVVSVVMMLFLLGTHSMLFAQRTVNVDQGFGTLNVAIDGDTTATGDRVDPNTVYVLQNGGTYLLDGTIEHRSYHLQIRTEDINGEKAQIIPGVGSGGESARPFTPRGDLTVEGLYITNEDELGGLNTRIIRIRADSVTITVRNCHLDKDGQAAFRFDNDGISVYIYNSIISNIGGDYDNGRGFDDRGNDIENLVVEHTTWYNIYSRPLRDGGGFIKYAKFNHNTFVNTGRRLLEFGEAVEVHFTNNLAINHSVLGDVSPSDLAVINVDSLTSESLSGLTQVVNISNNSLYRAPSYDAEYPDSVMAVPLFNPTAQAYIDEAGTGATNYEEDIMFTNGPAVDPTIVSGFWSNGGGNEIVVPFDVSGEPFDFSYPTNAAAYTQGTNNSPLGDLNWFGMAPSFEPERVVNVDQGFGTLNVAIDGDTTETGERVSSNTVYVLQNGGTYLLDGTIEHRSYHLQIRTEDINGEKAQIIPGVGSGGESARPFTPRGDLTVEGLYITNEDELGGLNTRIIRIRADSVTITVRNCHLDKDGQAAFRFDNDGISVYIYNSIISNIGGDYDNGRGFDDRGNDIENLVVEHTTWYNIYSRPLRDGGGFIKYAKFNHNTFVNTGRRLLEFGEAVEVHFTNNLAINHSVLGDVSPSDLAVINVDSLTSESLSGLTQVVNISNNSLYRAPSYDAEYPDSVMAVPLFNPTAQAYIDEAGTGATNYEEDIIFTNGPAVDPAIVSGFWSNGGGNEIVVPFDVSGEPFDFSYPTNAAAYTQGTNNSPLGDLNWFGLATSVKSPDLNIPEKFGLLSNYPNPFNPTTNIVYKVLVSGKVSLTVYNALGQKIRTLVNNEQRTAGDYSITWNGQDDAGRLVSSGVYFYRLDAGATFEVNKMLLLK